MYFPQLTFMRYIAALIVLAIHFANIDELMAIPFLRSFIYNGSTLLSFFFVMTGFVLTVSLKRDGQMPRAIPLKGLLLHRAVRLFPLHWLAIGLVLLMHQLYGWLNPAVKLVPVETGTLLAHVLLLHAWYPVTSFAINFNYVSWTLCVELLLVVLSPWLYGWLNPLPTHRLVRNVGLVWLGSVLVHQGCIQAGMPLDWGYLWPPFHVAEFLLGMGGGFLVCRHLPVLHQRAGRLHGLAYLGGALIIGLMATEAPWLHQNSLLFAPCYLLIVLSATVSDNWVTRLYCTRLCVYLGRISYGVYILQFPVAILVLRCLHPWLGWPYRYSALLFIVALTGLAALTHETIERPIIAYAKQRLTRRSLQPVTQAVGDIPTAGRVELPAAA